MKYNLVGVNGNAFAVMGYVGNAMKKEGKSQEDVKKYYDDAQSGDYNNLLAVSSDMVDKLNASALED